MSESNDKAPVPRQCFEDLGFELPEEAFSFYVEGSRIVFNVQELEEIGCSFMVRETQEEFPLSDEQLKKLRDQCRDAKDIASCGILNALSCSKTCTAMAIKNEMPWTHVHDTHGGDLHIVSKKKKNSIAAKE